MSISLTFLGAAQTVTGSKHLLEVNGQDLPGPMRLLILAAAAGVDLALKQDARGLG